MALTVEATRAQLETIQVQLLALKKQVANNRQEPATPLLNAALDAIKSYDEAVPLPLQNVLYDLGELSKMLKDDHAQQILSSAREQCTQLLIDMFVKNQQKIDKLSEGSQKLKSQYYSDFMQSKDQLARSYHQQSNPPKATGYLDTVLKFLDFLEPLRRAAFSSALHAQTIKYFRQAQAADTSFNQAHLSELMQLEIMQRLIHRTLMNEPSFDMNMLPTTSQSYQFMMKELVGRYHGIVVGNLSIGEHSYEAAREWVSHLNKVMNQQLETYQVINEVDKFTAIEQSRFEKKPYQPSAQMLLDKNATSEDFKQFKKYNESFIAELLMSLDNAYPPSAIVQFSDNKNNSHAIAIALDARGIWLHDAGRYCVYFPNKELGSNEAVQNFQLFFADYHHRNFQNLNQVSVVHIPEVRPAKVKAAHPQHDEALQREAPLLLGPGPQYSRQASFELETTPENSPEPTKPSLDPNRGPNKTGGF